MQPDTNGVGGSRTPVETQGHSASPTMEERVAAARAAYEPGVAVQAPQDILEAIDSLSEGSRTLGEINGRKVPPNAAPVRRRGQPAPARIASEYIRERKPGQMPTRRRKKPERSIKQVEDITDEQLLAEAGVVQFYSTSETAQFFDKTNQWIYWGLGRDTDGMPVFVYPDGKPILPERIGDPKTGRRRFTLAVIKAILLSSYRRGNVSEDDLKKILRRIRINELGGEWRQREGWHKIRGKWVHPNHCEKVKGEWVRKKGSPDEDH